MKKIIGAVLLLFAVITLSACDTSTSVKCGPGTKIEDGQCVKVDNDETPDDNETPDDDETPDDNETPVVTVPDNALELMANVDFSDSDISSWGTEGNVVLSHDSMGYLNVEVEAFTGEFYQENVTLGDLNTQAGNTYTISFTVKTDVIGGRDVQFFLEDTDAAYMKFFLEQETLTNEFQTFTYTYVATTTNNDTKIGMFLGTMENAFVGNVIIDSIQVVKVEGLQGTQFEDALNTDFSEEDLTMWTSEGNVVLSYDSNGYLVVNVTAFTGNFWEENITYRNLLVESWTTYTVTVTLKADVERDVILFTEDTNNNYAKYAEVTETVTTDWTTIELTFKPLSDNADTTLGIFFGDMANAQLGNVYIDSIVITATPFN